jgi:hypothetical protein
MHREKPATSTKPKMTELLRYGRCSFYFISEVANPADREHNPTSGSKNKVWPPLRWQTARLLIVYLLRLKKAPNVPGIAEGTWLLWYASAHPDQR